MLAVSAKPDPTALLCVASGSWSEQFWAAVHQLRQWAAAALCHQGGDLPGAGQCRCLHLRLRLTLSIGLTLCPHQFSIHLSVKSNQIGIVHPVLLMFVPLDRKWNGKCVSILLATKSIDTSVCVWTGLGGSGLSRKSRLPSPWTLPLALPGGSLDVPGPPERLSVFR